MKARTLIILAGTSWLLIGLFLLTLGVQLILNSIQASPHFLSPIQIFTLITKDRSQAALFVVTLGLYLGYLKGKFVLKKASQKQVDRILSLAEPLSLFHIYSPIYYLLIAFMMGLGFLLRILPIAPDLRGVIDLTIGSALIQGATHYFRNITRARVS